MAASGRITKIVLGLDGSPQAATAQAWAINLARLAGAEIVAVHAYAPPVYAGYPYDLGPIIRDEPRWRAEIQKALETEWSAPLREAGISYRTLVEDGRPAAVIGEVAEREQADIVVVGRRGLGGVAEMLLGSVSHELSHHCSLPVVLIPTPPEKERPAAKT